MTGACVVAVESVYMCVFWFRRSLDESIVQIETEISTAKHVIHKWLNARLCVSEWERDSKQTKL